ncbi:hypothetical protein AMATHDRAFT_50249 [Amanita thiersii Skay4041]|uniref:Uncharacterized protein n=1 Tax=Amanita thiersii Skay4041 TaxID=703135 RepID=A0A2A9NID1_9AGAR|nr:hypothetical protein AMATHDRAFT_50249 [Amanita thiersii Skay4041]
MAVVLVSSHEEQQPKEPRATGTFCDKIPADIIQLIFLFCLPETPIDIPSPDARHILSLSQVCNHWRYLAIGTSRLWSEVSLTLLVNCCEHCSVCSNTKRIQTAHTWLQRAGAIPRSLAIQATHSSDPISCCSKPLTNLIMESLILPFEFQKIYIQAHLSLVRHVAMYLLKQPSDTLEFLHLESSENYVHFRPDRGVDAIHLKDIQTSHNLHHLGLAPSTPLDTPLFLHILRTHPSLTAYQAYILNTTSSSSSSPSSSRSTSTSTRTPPTLHHTHLHALDLFFLNPSTTPPTLLRSLHLPNLTSLKIACPTDPTRPRYTSSTITEFLHRCTLSSAGTTAPALQELILGPVDHADPFELGELLRYAPALVYLDVLGTCTVHEGSVRAIARGEWGACLEVLVLGNARDPDRVVQMLELRSAAAGKVVDDKESKKRESREGRESRELLGSGPRPRLIKRVKIACEDDEQLIGLEFRVQALRLQGVGVVLGGGGGGGVDEEEEEEV